MSSGIKWWRRVNDLSGTARRIIEGITYTTCFLNTYKIKDIMCWPQQKFLAHPRDDRKWCKPKWVGAYVASQKIKQLVIRCARVAKKNCCWRFSENFDNVLIFVFLRKAPTQKEHSIIIVTLLLVLLLLNNCVQRIWLWVCSVPRKLCE